MFEPARSSRRAGGRRSGRWSSFAIDNLAMRWVPPVTNGWACQPDAASVSLLMPISYTSSLDPEAGAPLRSVKLGCALPQSRRSRSGPAWLSAVLLLVVAGGVSCRTSQPAATKSGVQITTLTNRLRVEINGQLFTEYYFANVPRPFCYPLLGPGGLAMTRNYPMQSPAGEEHDHPHHRSLWFGHGLVNGQNFWTEQEAFGRQVHQRFTAIESGADSGVIKAENQWVAGDGKVICTDDRVLRVYARPDNERVFDFEITLHAGAEPLALGDTKEGMFALRIAESMRLTKPVAKGAKKGEPGAGHIVNSAGDRDGAAWGKRAAWVDYVGPVDGKTVGVAIFDHPANPHHPPWWHARDYGLLAANPVGQHDFEKLPDPEAGTLVIPAGGHATFRYRIYLHEGDATQAKVAERFRDYAAPSK